MRVAFKFGLIALVAALAACSSTPVHYYTLRPPLTQETTATPRAPFLINVLPVGISAELDQPQMVVRQGESGMTVLDTERWASPLGNEVREALSSHLTTLLNTQDVAGLPEHSSEPVLLVKVQVRRLDAWPGQRVQLVADWELAFANDPRHVRVSGSSHFDQEATGSYAQLTSAYQQAIRALAGRILIDTRALANSSQVSEFGAGGRFMAAPGGQPSDFEAGHL